MEKFEKVITRHKILLTIFYSFIYSVSLIIFLQPAHLIATGLTGFSQLLAFFVERFNIENSFGLIYMLINIPGIVLGFIKIGKRFTFYSLISVISVTIFSAIIPKYIVTEDILLNCIFGGVVMGYALGGLLKIGASSGGTDFYGIWLYQKYGFNFGKVTTLMNVFIVICSMLVFDIEIALYTLVCFFARQITMNFMYTNNNKLTVWIIGEDLSKVSTYINQKLGRGTSIFEGVKGGYSREPKEAIMVILNNYEYYDLIEDIFKIAPEAFINVTKTHKVSGNYRIKKDLK